MAAQGFPPGGFPPAPVGGFGAPVAGAAQVVPDLAAWEAKLHQEKIAANIALQAQIDQNVAAAAAGRAGAAIVDVMGGQFPGPNWCAADAIQQAQQFANAAGVQLGGAISRYVGWTGPNIEVHRAGSAAETLWNNQDLKQKQKQYPHAFFWAAVRYVTFAVCQIGDGLMSFAPIPQDVPNGVAQIIYAGKAIRGILGKFSGISIDWPGDWGQYTLNYFHPTVTVDWGGAVSAYLADEFSLAQAYDYGKANGVCQFATQTAINTQQTRLDAAGVTELWLRGDLDDAQHTTRLRALGYVQPGYADELRGLTAWKPDAGTVQRWLQSGATDSAEVKVLGLDEGFSKRYDQQYVEWTSQLGMDDAQQQLLWRSHWHNMDPQTAVQLYWRDNAGMLPQGTSMSKGDLRSVLRRNGLAPGSWDDWIEAQRVLINRRQLVQLVHYRKITQGRAAQYLEAEGMSPEDADLEAEQIFIEAKEWQRRHVGGPGAAEVVKMYAEFIIGEQEAFAELQAMGFDAQWASEALAEGRLMRDRQTRRQLAAWMHGKYITGKISAAQASSVLAAYGFDGTAAGELIRLWQTELEVMPKELSAAEDLDAYCKGLISETDLVQRLARMRYSAADIQIMIDLGNIKCWRAKMVQAERMVAPTKGKLAKAQGEWGKIIGIIARQEGAVSQHTRTKAGAILGTVKHDLLGSPPPGKSLAGKARAKLLKEGANVRGNPLAPAATTGPSPTAGAAPGGKGATSSAALAPQAAPPAETPATSLTPPAGGAATTAAAPTTGQAATAQPPAPQSGQSGLGLSTGTGATATATGTPPA
jgi:hypothetical protein